MKHARADYNRIQDPAGKIPDDEPVLLIRGQDIIAPKVLRFYAAHAAGAGATDNLVMAVLGQAREMENWQREHAVKVPDMPADKVEETACFQCGKPYVKHPMFNHLITDCDCMPF